MAKEKDNPGLDGKPRRDWPKPIKTSPIEAMKPGSKVHDRVISYLKKRLEASESKMSYFYSRWRINEMKQQAYIDLPDYEERLKQMNDRGEPPKVIPIVVPYGFATVATIQTFLLHTFCGRKPMFQVGTYNTDKKGGARKMETMIQYNMDHSRAIRHMAQSFQDISTYGLSILGTKWMNDQKMRTIISREPRWSVLGISLGEETARKRELRLVYQGNEVRSIDPFMFFPDPNVPMKDVNRKGEFVFWRSFLGKHELKRMQADGILAYVDYAGSKTPASNFYDPDSARAYRSWGTAHPGRDFDTATTGQTSDYVQVDQGTITLCPRELGLSDSERPEMWIVTLLNKRQVAQIQPYDHDHGMHPVAVAEPYGMGYGFGEAGLMDYLGPLQDTISWFVNSHTDNVRKALNDMFVVDPAAVEMQDIKNPNPGKLIRLKPSAIGQDVRSVVHQLEVRDVTRGHISDANDFMRMGQFLSAVNDNVLGVQDFGGRKTATEVRTVGEAAASRLAALSRLLSAQQNVDLTEQMSLNIQQFQTMDFYLQILGEEAANEPMLIAPGELVGDYWYPIHDGTLPLDRVAMLDVWKEILGLVLQSELLAQSYDVGMIFEHVAELGGAKNIEKMRINPGGLRPDEAVAQQAQAGNLVPASALPGPSGLVNAVPERAANRVNGGGGGAYQ
jgi:hypothetical protein